MRPSISPCLSISVAAMAALSLFSPLALRAQESMLNTPVPATHATVASTRVLTLEPLTVEERHARTLLRTESLRSELPEDFREMGTVSAGQVADTRTLTLRFAAAATVTKIEGTPDFKVEQGGSCVEGYAYSANSTCTLLVRFSPQGAGRRAGSVRVTNSMDLTPLAIGIIGFGSAPTISFTPSIITTVPQTVNGTAGILSGAGNLALDGGDALYMADTGNKLLRYVNPNGTMQNINALFNLTDPQGVAVDQFNTIFLSQDNPATLIAIYPTSSATEFSSGTTSCAYGATCNLSGAPLTYAGALTTDPNGSVFLSVSRLAYRLLPTGAFTINYTPLANDYNIDNNNYTAPAPIAVDSGDNIYGYESYNGSCFISANPYYSAATDTFSSIKVVAGGRGCGFSGDGGPARSALIGAKMGQMTFDVAGNFYFADTLNHRVRRIDGATGIITTIAGSGAAGSSGDGGPATAAHLNSPTGIAVDSKGQVYIISLASSGQLVRKVTTVGGLNLGAQTAGIASLAQTVTVANSGNAPLNFLHIGLTTGNTSDFAMDVNTTTCNFTVPLAAGRSCNIGFIFKPMATGGRSAVFSMTDDTVAGINTIQLSGTGYTQATLTPAAFTFANTNVGAQSSAQTATLKNTGTATMNISSIAFSGTAATSYIDVTTCGTTLAGGASCTISVALKPMAVGSLPATLTVTDDAFTVHQTIALTGTGVGVAKASITPSSLAFASTTVGSTAAAKTITLSNPGTAALGITSITMTGTNAADFPLTKTCGTSLAVGASCTISVSFKPTAAGNRAGTVSIVASTGTITAAVTGPSVAAAAKAAVSKMTLVSAANPMAARQVLVLTARVAATSAARPTGRVLLMDGTRLMAEGRLSNGILKFRMLSLAPGMHMLSARYMGDAINAASISNILPQRIFLGSWNSPLLPGGLGTASPALSPARLPQR